MIFSINKFGKEISKLNSLNNEPFLLSPLRQEQIKQEILRQTALSTKAEPEQSPKWNLSIKIWHLRYVLSFLLISGLIGGTVYASTGAVPGDSLYKVKRTKEHVQFTLAITPEIKAQLQTRFMQERANELETIYHKNELEPDIINQAKAEMEVGNAVSSLQLMEDALKNEGNTTTAQTICDRKIKLRNSLLEHSQIQLSGEIRQLGDNFNLVQKNIAIPLNNFDGVEFAPYVGLAVKIKGMLNEDASVFASYIGSEDEDGQEEQIREQERENKDINEFKAGGEGQVEGAQTEDQKPGTNP